MLSVGTPRGGIRRSHTYARVYLVANLVLGTHFSRRGVQAADAPPVNAWLSGAYPVFERVNVKKKMIYHVFE